MIAEVLTKGSNKSKAVLIRILNNRLFLFLRENVLIMAVSLQYQVNRSWCFSMICFCSKWGSSGTTKEDTWMASGKDNLGPDSLPRCISVCPWHCKVILNEIIPLRMHRALKSTSVSQALSDDSRQGILVQRHITPPCPRLSNWIALGIVIDRSLPKRTRRPGVTFANAQQSYGGAAALSLKGIPGLSTGFTTLDNS